MKRPMTSNIHRCQKSNLITSIAVMSSQKPSLESKNDHVNMIDSSDFHGSITTLSTILWHVTCANAKIIKIIWKQSDAFVEKGFKNWKKALEKFEKHHSCQCHRAASTYEILIPQYPDVAELFDNKEKDAPELNRRCFMAILDSIQYHARQGIPLRGHGMMKIRTFPNC